MSIVTEQFEFNGYGATVIRQDNPNGKWIWKTEFLYAFDKAERELNARGYTRVYYGISNKYGSASAVELMRKFHLHVVKKYSLSEQAVLFGFSRGGLYAFNYALKYPEAVEKVYLDAPVLDVRTWPPEKSAEQIEMFAEFGIRSLEELKDNPIDKLPAFFDRRLPLLLVAGGADEVVPFEANAGKVIKYCQNNGIKIDCFVKPDCKHHPHSLDDASEIIKFVEK